MKKRKMQDFIRISDEEYTNIKAAFQSGFTKINTLQFNTDDTIECYDKTLCLYEYVMDKGV